MNDKLMLGKYTYEEIKEKSALLRRARIDTNNLLIKILNNLDRRIYNAKVAMADDDTKYSEGEKDALSDFRDEMAEYFELTAPGAFLDWQDLEGKTHWLRLMGGAELTVQCQRCCVEVVRFDAVKCDECGKLYCPECCPQHTCQDCFEKGVF